MSQKLSNGKCDSTTSDAKRLFDRKLLAYAAAAGAAVVSGQAAQAITDTRQINVDVVNGSYQLDVDHNGSPDFLFTNSGTDSNVSGIGGNEVLGHFSSNPFFKEGIGPPGVTKASRLVSSNFVGASATSWSNSPKLTGPFADWNGESGFLGLQFEDTTDNLTHYGFVQMSVDSSTSPTPFAIHIDAVSWDTVAGERIHVTDIAVPEPVGLGALALGAAGLASLRRRRRSA